MAASTTRHTISRCEARDDRPSKRTLNQLAETYGKEPEWFLNETEAGEGASPTPQKHPNPETLDLLETSASIALRNIQDELTANNAGIITSYIRFFTSHQAIQIIRAEGPRINVKANMAAEALGAAERRLTDNTIRLITNHINFLNGDETRKQKPRPNPKVR